MTCGRWGRAIRIWCICSSTTGVLLRLDGDARQRCRVFFAHERQALVLRLLYDRDMDAAEVAARSARVTMDERFITILLRL